MFLVVGKLTFSIVLKLDNFVYFSDSEIAEALNIKLDKFIEMLRESSNEIMLDNYYYFVYSRKECEKIARYLNDRLPSLLVMKELSNKGE